MGAVVALAPGGRLTAAICAALEVSRASVHRHRVALTAPLGLEARRAPSARAFDGSNSGKRETVMSGGRARTSAIHACGSMSFILQLTVRAHMKAAFSPPRSDPATSHDLLPDAIPLSAHSAALLVRQMRPSSRNAVKAAHRSPSGGHRIVDCLGDAVVFRQSGALLEQPAVHPLDRWAASALPCSVARSRVHAVDFARRMSKIAQVRFTASSATGEMAGAGLFWRSVPLKTPSVRAPRRAPALSAGSKTLRRAWLRYSALRIGPGARLAGYWPDRGRYRRCTHPLSGSGLLANRERGSAAPLASQREAGWSGSSGGRARP